jgi:hypothetical protein
MRPFLVGPDARDAAKWRRGKFEFADKAEKHVLVLAILGHPGFAYNPKPRSGLGRIFSSLDGKRVPLLLSKKGKSEGATG